MDFGPVLFFLRPLIWTETESESINTSKKIQVNIQPSFDRTSFRESTLLAGHGG